MKFKLLESKEDRQKLIDFIGEDLANKFFEYRKRIKPPYNDLYYWLKLSKKQAIFEINTIINRLEKNNGLVLNNSQWKVYKIDSSDLLNNIVGRHKEWCIQIPDSFEMYSNKGDIFYLYINKEDNKKYLRVINPNDEFEEGIWGEDNRRIRDKEFIKSLPLI